MLVLDAKKLKSLIALKGWTQAKLAKEASMSQWEMSRLMQGKCELNPEDAARISKALGCKTSDYTDKYVKAKD